MKRINVLIITLIVFTLSLSACNLINGRSGLTNNDISKSNQTQKRVVVDKVSYGSENDVINGVTSIDTSEIWTAVTEIDFSKRHETWIMNEDSSLVPMDEPYFESELVDDRTYKIRSDGDYCYALAGDEIGIMFDCGYGAGNVREYAEKLLGVPVKYVVNSHYHFDHTANNSYFDAAFMTEESVPYATIPYKSFEEVTFLKEYPIIIVEDGYKLNLGNRELEIIKFPYPNHTIGALAMIDNKNGLLFTGDEFLFPTKVDLKYVTLNQYKETMEHLYLYKDKVNKIFAGTGEKDVSILDSYFNATINAILKTPDPNEVKEISKKSNYVKKDVPTDAGHTIYVRGHVREGDETENPPEVEIKGDAKTYTYNGFTITYRE